ncbi:hypothetical protein BOO86_22930 [Mycobacterium sp. CBMA 234]|uniref:PPE domain-containing protein n=1 Tax=Mycolicibacterium sp. CBMA 234 TaxID=1918495 RepID=UPI0012DCF93A|nr:hypothetical protein [Mycolicibacterium sp. CBMA 234]MUL67347.1 hypothetical protein [Mycolicibacterium sp. CBMA 234]
MPETLKVSSETLRTKATEVDVDLPTLPEAPNPPCELTIAQDATGFLKDNLKALNAALKAGRNQNRRLAACLQAAAAAYDAADAAGKSGIDATALGAGGGAPITPNLPPEMEVPAGSELWIFDPLESRTYQPSNPDMDWEVAAAQINGGDQGASLGTFATQMNAVATQLSALNGKFNMAGVEWEGDAARAAEDALKNYATWLEVIGFAASTLAGQAQELSSIHGGRRPEHPNMQDVQDYENASVLATAGQAAFDFFTGHATKQEQSDTVRKKYAQQATISSLFTPPLQDFGKDAWPAVKPGDVAHKKDGNGTGTGGNQSTGDGGTPSPEKPSTPEMPSTSPASAGSQKPEGGGSPSGGSPSGGSPSGGSPSGGSPSGGGAPSGLGEKPEMPKLPDGPGLSPASAGGAGGGSAGGGGGGGLGGQPMQPAATAPAIGGAGGAEAGGASQAAGRAPVGGGGGMGGGMGGGGHGGNREGGKEKKRNANLSPDEVLYKEDRAFTDGVIGHRRRTKIDDKKETK